MKLMDMDEAEATHYKKTVSDAIKNSTLYDISFQDLE
jgi:hypothetical protein